MEKIDYSKYIGSYAKRFYTSFEEENILKIIGCLKVVVNRADEELGYFVIKDAENNEWEWDVDDCVIIVDNVSDNDDLERIAFIGDPKYKGYDPYNKTII